MSDQWSGAEEESKRLADLPSGSGKSSGSNARPGPSAETRTQPGVERMASADSMKAPTDMNRNQGKPEPGGAITEKADKAKEALSTVSEKATELTDQATSKADAGMEMAAGGLDSLADKVRKQGESMGEGQVATLATAAADRMQSGAEMIRSKDADQMMTDLEGLIRRRPVESLLVAAGIGYLISRAK